LILMVYSGKEFPIAAQSREIHRVFELLMCKHNILQISLYTIKGRTGSKLGGMAGEFVDRG
jgi:hypothetical protein